MSLTVFEYWGVDHHTAHRRDSCGYWSDMAMPWQCMGMLEPDLNSAGGAGAAQLCRGVRRLLWSLGYASVTEFPLANGRRADVFAVTPGCDVAIVEIKSSIADFRADQKWPDYRGYCDSFFFAVGEDFPKGLIPDVCGLIVADGFGAAILRGSMIEPLAGARRKSLLNAFGQAAASRLHRLQDPMLGSGAA